ncbi:MULTISPECIES: GntR family transcriptional regulator [Paraburkholderia]|jgi:DNA-binding GntR family transcriptional regulator|uniref:GntR family transcriptional regulator n=2 Tax=Paraburkholderia TaxID=1822464 RepID=A0AAN1MLF3_9BURK|nr:MULTISPECIES: GntR family transcriptional regulator [Paraburkholderia]SOE91012.1 DNA-binding transcriptional regulator, GntR family [Burkholderia sp. YR290]AUT71425.1 GntR family transcriptional regulator [Paraburkholderia hospita]EIM94325.1 GntR family transcriptional regulator [Paraburkholderia hospita]OUL68485.1 GntR family transcriptional regulator [Paraburkholderia hospita]OUL74318.1 GntR family transcriptional regulator [Paraburkholderia hospita]
MEESVHSFRAGFAVTAEEEAYAYVLYRIRMGKYRAGDRLIPEEIAAEIDTSRMPVREAFRRLASEGLVVIRPNRGAIVRGLDADEMEEVFCMRGALEGLAAKLALPGIMPAHIAELARLIEVMESHEQDAHQWVSAHRNFHEYLCQLSGRKRLVAQIAGLHTVVEPHMRLWLQLADKQMTSRDDHTTIIDAIKSGDPMAVEATVREHIEATVPALRQWMTSGR